MLLRSMTSPVLPIAFAFAVSAASAAPVAAEHAGALLEAYGRLTGYLCGDPEYLACLGIGTAQCEQDMKTESLSSCAQRPYVVADQPGRIRMGEPRFVPVDLAECVYLSHIALHGRDAADVHACMAAAKLAR